MIEALALALMAILLTAVVAALWIEYRRARRRKLDCEKEKRDEGR